MCSHNLDHNEFSLKKITCELTLKDENVLTNGMKVKELALSSEKITIDSIMIVDARDNT